MRRKLQPRNYKPCGPKGSPDNVVVISPNSSDPFNTCKTVNGKAVEHDPNVENVLDEIGELASQWYRRIIIEGHTDSSMKGQVRSRRSRTYLFKRARRVRKPLLKKYTALDPNRFNVDGVGWDKPVDPLNRTKNRRVEIKVLTAEKAN